MKTITIWVDDKFYDDVHIIMNMHLRDDDSGLVVDRMYEGKSKQEWYRRVLRKGLVSLLHDFNQRKKQYEIEDNI